MRIGVIGGTGLYALLDQPETVRVETPYGDADVESGLLGTTRVFFLNRHGAGHRVPPHRIDARRTIDALARCKVDAVVAVNNVGGLTPSLAPGHLVVPHDFVDLFPRADFTLFDDDVVHVELSAPYCPHVRTALLDAARSRVDDGDRLHDAGVYVGVRGPRLETPAEVRFFSGLGDVIGMTGCPEAALARERGLCYASLAYVANQSTARGTTADQIRDALADDVALVVSIVQAAARAVPEDRDCGCRGAVDRGRFHDPRTAPKPEPVAP